MATKKVATVILTVVILTTGCSPQEPKVGSAAAPVPTADSASSQPAASAPVAATSKAKSSAIKSLTAQHQEQLLAARLDGEMGSSFNQFANMFLVASRVNLDWGVGLVTPSKEIAESELRSPFPGFYKPTLRELLDAIALQTFSEWKYEPSGKYVQSDLKRDPPVERLAIFEFTRKERKKPFTVALAKGWKAIDKGNWLMLVPPTFPVGMDVYEMGTYSSENKQKEKELLKRVPAEVALEWARRVHESATEKDIKPGKVGPYNALFFETMVPAKDGHKLHWRQWVFLVDKKCYFVVSTIFPEFEKAIYPDVEKMLKSFQITPR
jgi:hypothetical protein